ncbi:PaaI family thioesterase [Nonomuraea sp. B19D2]|uniref:PaaI family thioesterase n=1 Tax=Nonomuraea sp. B19D2 TaxID=3159561 RepID=UPI0032DBD5D6
MCCCWRSSWSDRCGFHQEPIQGDTWKHLSEIRPGHVQIVLPSRPEVTQQHGYIHAGATSAIADSAGGCAALTLFPDEADVLTVEYKINLLAPAVGDHLEAVGTVVKAGRTLTVCRLEVFGVAGARRNLIATGQQTLICLREDPDSDQPRR